MSTIIVNTSTPKVIVNSGMSTGISAMLATLAARDEVLAALLVNKYNATAAPTANDDSANTSGNGAFSVGSVWVDITGNEAYRCLDSTPTAAIWETSTLTIDDLGSMATQNASAVTITGGTINGVAGSFTTLAASGNVTLSGGTANGVAFLNAGKVLTTGSGFQYSNNSLLTVPDLFLASTSQTYLGDNGVFGGGAADGNSVLSYFGGSYLAIKEGGTERARFTAAGHFVVGHTAAIDPYGTSNHRLLTLAGTWGGVTTYGIGSTVYASVGNRPSGNTGLRLAAYGATSLDIVEVVTNGSVRATFDVNGNAGLGVTPAAWFTGNSFRALQLTNSASVHGQLAGGTFLTGISSNWYADAGGSDKYIANGYASQYRQWNGAHSWLTAPSGTAGDPISFTQAMNLTASGCLIVGQGARYNDELFSLRAAAASGAPVVIQNTSAGKAAILLLASDNGIGGAISATVGATYGLKIDSVNNLDLSIGGATAATLTSTAFDVVSAKNEVGIVVGPTTGTWAVDDFIGVGFRVRNTAGGVVGGNNLGAAIYGIQTNAGENTGGLSIRTRRDASTFDEAVRWDSYGNQIQKLNASAPTLGTNSTMTFELTSNTSLTVKVRGSDGTTRSVALTLA